MSNIQQVQHAGNREAWLTAMAKELEPLIQEQCGLTMPDYRIACSWPSRLGLASRRQRIGECWSTGSTANIKEIFISPTEDDSIEVGSTTAQLRRLVRLCRG
jgi:hypothetical protein